MPDTIYHVYNQTVADGTATSVVRPSDWNSAHSISVDYLEGYEPFNMANAISTTYLPGAGTWYIQPFIVPKAISSGHIAQLWSYSGTSLGVLAASGAGGTFGSNTTGTVTHSHSAVHSIALFSIGTGTNSTQLQSFWSNTWGLNIARSVSVVLTNASNVRVTYGATITYINTVGSDGAYTTTTWTSSGSQSSTNSSWATSAMSSIVSSGMNILSGQLRIPFGFNTTVGAGQYWLGVAYSTSSTSAGSTLANPWPPVNKAGIYGMSSMPYRRFGLTVSNTSQQQWLPAGIYSVVSAAPPGTVQSTQVRSVASHVTEYFNWQRNSATA
jgi:hypothetical protein